MSRLAEAQPAAIVGAVQQEVVQHAVVTLLPVDGGRIKGVMAGYCIHPRQVTLRTIAPSFAKAALGNLGGMRARVEPGRRPVSRVPIHDAETAPGSAVALEDDA